MNGLNYRTRLIEDLGLIGRDHWDGLVRASMRCGDPAGESCRATDGLSGGQPDPLLPAFLRYDFLHALQHTGCVGPGTGWQPLFLTLWHNKQLLAATPLYAKAHSYGEYVFDWAWADAYERHGLQYYPKLLSAIPFTPVTGPRLLAVDAQAQGALIDALLEQARESRLSSLHLLYPRADEAEALRAAGSDMTDEASAIEQLGLQPRLVESDSRNLKVTYPQDLELASLIQGKLNE